MRKIFIIYFALVTCVCSSQTWQWGQRGGSTDNLSTGGGRIEEVSSIVTDSDGNIYMLSAVGIHDVDIAGIPKTAYGDSTTLTDYALVSFSCDGSYRWSKIIGGAGKERINKLSIDAEDNVYLSGQLDNCTGSYYPSRIDDDVILDENTQDACRLLFLLKYNKNGVMQWIRYPEIPVPLEIAAGKTNMSGMENDNLGNIYLLCTLPPGTYADGGFVNETPGSRYYILKYSSDGLYLNATYVDIVKANNVDLEIEFYRNPYNNNFYFTGDRRANQSAQIAGQDLGPGFFMASFDSNGQFLWKREANDPDENHIRPYGLLFDSDNNIYISGQIIGFNMVDFLGFSVSETILPSFIMKLNPTASSIIWASNHNRNSYHHGGFTMKGNELAITNSGSQTFTWGSQSVFVNNDGEGLRAYIARFNKDTGVCTDLSFIPGNSWDNKAGTAITSDVGGDYIVGGHFAGTQTFLTNSSTSIGGQSDFFIAKYATSVCSLGMEEQLTQALHIYPNPVRDIFTVEVTHQVLYTIFSITGLKVMEGQLNTEHRQIDINKLASGTYLLRLGTAESYKILKL